MTVQHYRVNVVKRKQPWWSFDAREYPWKLTVEHYDKALGQWHEIGYCHTTPKSRDGLVEQADYIIKAFERDQSLPITFTLTRESK